MSLNEIVGDLTNDLDSGGVDALAGSLQTLAQINPVQFKANETALNNSFGLLLGAMRSNIRRNKQQIDPSMNFSKILNKITTALPKNIVGKYSSEINRIKSQVAGVAVGNIIDQVRNEEQIDVQNMIFRQALQQNDLANMNFQKSIPASNFDSESVIERSIRSIKPLLLEKNPTMTGVSDIPNSIRYLSKFAALQKKIPLGQASDIQGLAFVGLSKQDAGNGTDRIVPFMKNDIMKTGMPNLPVLFKYHANKTMSSWNKFIQNEAKFVKLVSEISTPTSRSAYVEKQFKNLNNATFAAEVLATLMYYYVFIPTQRYLKQKRSTVQDQDGFYVHYFVGGLPSTNPLLLTNQAGAKVAKILLNKTDPVVFKTPIVLLTSLVEILKKYSSTINKKQMQKCFYHNQRRRLQTVGFLQSSGLQTKVITNLLSISDFSSVKKKRFVLSTGYQNNQFVTIVQKITVASKQKQTDLTWDYVWGSQYMACHDYIWK